jgi:pimeloyl-ACP methyl ester carboxylesterase
MCRFLLSICVVALCVARSIAQDRVASSAYQVQKLSLEYKTLRQATALTAQRRAQVDRLGKRAQEASRQGRYGDALKYYQQAIALMRGKQWTPALALAFALALELDCVVLEPNQTVKARLSQSFSLDEKPVGKFDLTVALHKMKGNDSVKILKRMNSLNSDFFTHPLLMEFVVPEIEDGHYRIAVVLKGRAGEKITKHEAVTIVHGLSARIAAAKSRAEKIRARLKAAEDELLGSMPAVEYRIAAVEQASTSKLSHNRLDFNKELKEIEQMLDELNRGRDPLALRSGDFRRVVRSRFDRQLQPYRIFVPSSYDGTRPFPLIIALHGKTGDENTYFDVYAKGAIKAQAERHGYIIACPRARPAPSMYTGAGEQDVLDVIRDVERVYRIDRDRIYLTGHSMGGYGTWAIAINNPDLFAAIAPVAGGGDPSSMAKIAHIPQLVIHGDDDKTVSVERSRQMVAAAKRVGAEVRFIEVIGGTHSNVVSRTYKYLFEWFDWHRRRKQ